MPERCLAHAGKTHARLTGAGRIAACLALALLAACADGAPPPVPGPLSVRPETVIVERGDTLSGLARRHGVPLAAIAAANGLSPPYRIHPGQVLHVPRALPAPVPPIAAAGAPGSALGSPGPAQPVPPPAVPAPLPAGPAARAVIAEPLPPPAETRSPGAASAPSPAPSAAPSQAVAALPMPPPAPPHTPPVAPAAATPAAAPAGHAAERAPQRSAEPLARSRRLPPGRFAWPVRGEIVSGFGAKGGGLVNDGMNIAAPRGTPVRAAADGTVIYAGNEVRGFGNLVLIRHEGGWVTAYGHADRVLVRQGQAVRMGEEIARVGSSGSVATPQLHFQVRRDGRPVDPAAHLERAVANRGA